MRLLGIETSCDETAAAVVEVNHGRFSVLSNVVSSQIKIHAKTGGVVPEVAARAHVEKIIPVIEKAIISAKLQTTCLPCLPAGRPDRQANYKLQAPSIDVIAVTTGPGLITSLLVGVEAARTLSYIWKKPLVAVNHLEGHVYANWLPSPQSSPHGGEGKGEGELQFPILCLIVSGGHTELVLMKKHLDYQVIGATRDDAVGECFDKVAKMFGLGYPGGPAIAAEAAKVLGVRGEGLGIDKLKPKTYNLKPIFPRPMIDSPDFDFSFSGLKTAVLYYVRDFLKKSRCQKKMRPHLFLTKRILQEVCYSFQEAVVDVLVSKTIRAAKKYKVKTVMLGGGVAANTRLREQLAQAIDTQLQATSYKLPALQYTTDNAAMIAAAGYFHALKKDFMPWQRVGVDPNWELGQKMVKL